jgi:hypothetical protein
MPGQQNTKGDEVGDSRVRRKRRREDIRLSVGPIRTTLRMLTRAVTSFQAILSHVPIADRLKVEVPDSLVRAWLHLIMALAQSSQGFEGWSENLDVAEALIRRGMGEIMDSLPAEDLVKDIIIHPMELVLLMSWRLLQDSNGKYPNLNDTYSEYIKALVSRNCITLW